MRLMFIGLATLVASVLALAILIHLGDLDHASDPLCGTAEACR